MAVTTVDLVKSNMQVSVFMLMMSYRFSIMPLPDPVNWHLAIDKVSYNSTKAHNLYYCLVQHNFSWNIFRSTSRSTRAFPPIQSLAKRTRGQAFLLKIGADTATIRPSG